jgi:hypothetical protein
MSELSLVLSAVPNMSILLLIVVFSFFTHIERAKAVLAVETLQQKPKRVNAGLVGRALDAQHEGGGCSLMQSS